MKFAIVAIAGLWAAGAAVATAPVYAQAVPAPRPVTVSRSACNAAFRLQHHHYFATPMSEAIPGFNEYAMGVWAMCRHDYAGAVHRFKLGALWGYQRAEYSLGVMYFDGQGVPVNQPLGAAWMILAAQGGTPGYVKVRDLMVTALTDAQFEETDKLWSKLRKTYGDKVALRRAQDRWRYVLTSETGSHVGHPDAPIAAYVPQAGSGNGSGGAGVVWLGVAGQYHAMHEAAGPYQALEKYVTGKVTVGPLGLLDTHGTGNAPRSKSSPGAHAGRTPPVPSSPAD